MAELSASRVADWLKQHPDFLDEHPDVLAALQVAHDSGVASLIERQVEVLRDENDRLRRQLALLSGIAGENERLMQRLHRLSLDLMAIGEAAPFLSELDRRLREDFRADEVRLLLDDPSPAPSDSELARPLPDSRPDWLSQLLAEGEPACGRLTLDKRTFCFGDHGSELGSAALVPIGDAGLLAIGATSDERFHPDMGTLFLRLLGETIQLRLKSLDEAGRRRRA
ncbi:MAG: DUF484 family protein [Wenzhouxiangellaceae bacterium]|nr:DUF484 family protein [Wenzhouxiangellaceae bacterium]